MQSTHAKQVGALAAQALKSDEESTIGQVIATFPNSFYVKTRTDQLLFITNRSLRSPITVNVQYSGSFTDIIKPFDLVRIHDGRLCSSNLSIDLANDPPENEKTSPNNGAHYAKLTEASTLLSRILRIIDNAGSVLDSNQTLLHDSIGYFVKKTIIPLRAREFSSEFTAAALKIIGLGKGFTPSGDDFLLGFLFTYNSLSSSIPRTPICLEFTLLAARTNWISAKLLDYAQHLQVDDQLLWLIQSMSDEHADTVTAVETLFPRGHTSGIDIATGVVFGMTIACDIALRQRRTEAVAANLGFL